MTTARPTLPAVLVALGTVLAATTPVLAYGAESAAPEPLPNAAMQKHPDQRVCRKVRVTSTRIPQRVCLTRRQWDELTEQGRRTSQQMRNAAENARPAPVP